MDGGSLGGGVGQRHLQKVKIKHRLLSRRSWIS
jgi:hypothetical protein